MIEEQGIISINKQFDKGNVINKGSLDFALSSAKRSKNWLKQLSIITRAILIDHVFEEGNKRTASALIMSTMETYKIAYDPYEVDRIIIKILKENITSINKIQRLIKNAIR